MDPQAVMTAAVAFLAPYTPQLLELGKKSAEEAAKTLSKKGAEAGWNKAVNLWTKLSARFKKDPKITAVTQALATDPQDKDFQVKLASLFAERLADDPALTEELAQILGGQARVQEMLAENNSLLLAVEQQMQGSGKQTIKATGNSAIIGARQVMG